MAISSVVLDIRANTERALGDFKKFSSQLDNKFLVSGLKLDVVRSALGQINREFQKAIGEQGLQAGMSLKAAENQAAAIMDVFKSVGPGASKAITEQFSTAFSEIAVKAGGTAEDIKKALSATSFISTNLSEDVRKSIATGILDVQRDFRRAGLGEDFGGVMKKFLAGEINAGQMIGSGDAMQVMLGNELMRKSGTIDTITNAEQRSKAINDLVNDPRFTKTLSDMAKQAYGFRATIEDLNTYLFNPKSGIFGALREVTMSIGDKTTVFKETGVLVESVFGRQGLFVNFFKQIGKIFGLEDPLKVIIIGIRFITRQFDKLNAFIQTPEFQGMVKKIQDAFNIIKDFAVSVFDKVTEAFSNSAPSVTENIKNTGKSVADFFKTIFDTISQNNWDPASTQKSIQDIGAQIRGFIESIGKSIRDTNVEKQGTFFLEIFKTVIGEVAQTLGTVIKEAILTIFSGKGAAVLGGAITVLYEGLSKFFTGLFGGNQGAGAALGGAAMAALGVLFVRKIRGALESILRPISAMSRGGGGALGFVNRLLGGGSGPADPNLNPMTGRAAFQGQVIARMDAIIRILAGGGAADIDYGGPSSSVDGGRGRRNRGGDGSRGRRARGRTQYSGSIGPLPEGSAEPWTLGDDKFEPYLDARANGRGGRRARMGRRLRGIGRGFRRGGAILAGTGLLLGAGAAFAGQEGGDGEQQVGAGEAWGRVGASAASSALLGAEIGSVIPGVGTALGAGIGAAIGAATQLFNKGVREAIGKSVTEFFSNIGNTSKKLWDGLVSGVMKAFDNIKSFASSIDWKNILLDTFLPGRALIRAGAEAAGMSRETKDEGPLGGLKSWLLGAIGMRETGGTVIRGTSYIVGERGPEIFTPGATGSISSNRDLMTARSSGAGSSVSANFNISINVNGNMGAGDVEALRVPVLRIVEEAWASATQGTVSRGSMG